MSTTKYQGSCHCGAVKIAATLDLDQPVIACNCSICSRGGWFLAFVPQEAVELSGQESLTDYQFGKKHIHHAFCKTCGMRPYGYGENPADGKMMYAVNVRCLDGVELDKLKVQNYDGKSL